MYITISGLPGSGKSTVAKMLAKKLNWPRVNAGAIFRAQATKAGLTLEEFGDYLAKNPDEDMAIDELVLTFARKHKKAVLEGRVAGWLAKKQRLPALKIWLKAPLAIRAKRAAERDHQTIDEAMKAIKKREGAERERYFKMYGLDIRRRSIYNVAIPTEKLKPDEIVRFILKKIPLNKIKESKSK